MRDSTSTTLEVNPTSVIKLFLVRRKKSQNEEEKISLNYCPVGIVGLLTRFTWARLISSLVEDDLSRQHFRGRRWRAPWMGWAAGFHNVLLGVNIMFSITLLVEAFFVFFPQSKTFEAALLPFNHDRFIYFLVALEHTINSSKFRHAAPRAPQRAACGSAVLEICKRRCGPCPFKCAPRSIVFARPPVELHCLLGDNAWHTFQSLPLDFLRLPGTFPSRTISSQYLHEACETMEIYRPPFCWYSPAVRIISARTNNGASGGIQIRTGQVCTHRHTQTSTWGGEGFISPSPSIFLSLSLCRPSLGFSRVSCGRVDSAASPTPNIPHY